ncbi:hypothetical protein chiPu_0019159 [Chiloscyllium punctatum]|uniref:Nanos-type domain-containing protein n=1 Tax=Chiloscyllium punctatum TaxID=137246 RepID=A0A401RQZ6_CHIPU|nr:hypothetical protein [Chiloscyllium punctatum]
MAGRAFDIWSDYLGLSKVMDSIVQSRRRQTLWQLEPDERRLGTGEKVGRDLKAQSQHKPEGLRNHSLTMELGTGLFLTINVKDIEDRSCRGETSRQFAAPVQSHHPAAFTTGDASMGRQHGPRSLAQADMLEALVQPIPAKPGSRGRPAEFTTGPGLEGSSPSPQVETRRPQVTGTQTACRIGQALLICTFCKQNGESRKIYASHVLKDKDGRTVCPILRRYTCPVCKATGDSAHTKRFCQSLRENYRSTYNKTSRDTVCTNKMEKLFKK